MMASMEAQASGPVDVVMLEFALAGAKLLGA
jgi:hypothetical protein